MNMKVVARKFIKKDLSLILRDSFLLFMTFFVVIISVIFRFGLPYLNNYLCAKNILPCATITKSLSDFYPLLISFIACFEGALIIGTVFGFALLDEKDDNTVKAMLVTPVPFFYQVMYRIIVPTIIATLVVFAQVLFIGQALIPLWKLIFISAGAALIAPMAALFYATFAENKIQGFAFAKFVGLVGWIIILAWFVSEPWQWLFGLFPPFLISKAYWMAYQGHNLWYIALVVGIVLQLCLLALLVRWFKKAVYK